LMFSGRKDLKSVASHRVPWAVVFPVDSQEKRIGNEKVI
jgi:hypothetical protein